MIQKPPSGIRCASLHHFSPNRDRELWSDWLGDLIRSQSSAKKHNKILTDHSQRKRKAGIFPTDQCVNHSSHFGPCLLLFALISALAQMLPRGLFHLCEPRRHLLLLLLLTCSLSPALFDIFLSRTFSQSLPGFFFSSPVLLSAAPLPAACCTAVRRGFSCTPSLLSHYLSLFLTHLCSSLSHISSLSHTLALHQQHICCRIQQNLHMPLIHINNPSI